MLGIVLGIVNIEIKYLGCYGYIVLFLVVKRRRKRRGEGEEVFRVCVLILRGLRIRYWRFRLGWVVIVR